LPHVETIVVCFSPLSWRADWRFIVSFLIDVWAVRGRSRVTIKVGVVLERFLLEVQSRGRR
jgi:hypothetical protein